MYICMLRFNFVFFFSEYGNFSNDFETKATKVETKDKL